MFAGPLLVALASGPLLGEWPGPRRLAAIGVGLIGVLVGDAAGLWRHASGGAARRSDGCFCYAFYSLSTRMLAGHDSSETTMVYSGAAGTLATVPLLPWIWETPQTALTWAVMVAAGALGGFGHWLLILAHRLAPATVLAPFIYSQIVWMLLLGWFVFRPAAGWLDLRRGRHRHRLRGSTCSIASGCAMCPRSHPRPDSTKALPRFSEIAEVL